MTIRDLPAILRIIDRVELASIAVSDGEHVFTFHVSELGASSALSLRSVLYDVYLRRGHSAVLARLKERKTKCGWCKRAWLGMQALSLKLRAQFYSLRQRFLALAWPFLPLHW